MDSALEADARGAMLRPMVLIMLFLPLFLALAGVSAGLWFAHWFLLARHQGLSSAKKFTRQIIMLALTIIGVVIIAITLPVLDSTRNQVIAFIGIVLSGIFAFSSTTLFANIMAGVMMRITRPFRSGDFIRTGDCFGRVAERGILDTEIQTENRDLIAIPNTFLITHPVSVIRSSGTVVSASVSLGYDVHHSRIEKLLKAAAGASGLEEPFVHVTALGDFSVTYKANGMLKDVKSVLTAQSDFHKAILDALHGDQIEIVSPSFMNQRQGMEQKTFIPEAPAPAREPEPKSTAEEIVFDKAEKAEKRELERIRLLKEVETLEAQAKEAPEEQREALKERILRAKTKIDELDRIEEESGESSQEA